MSNTNRKNTGRTEKKPTADSKPEAGRPKSEPKAERTKRKAVVKPEEQNNSAIVNPHSKRRSPLEHLEEQTNSKKIKTTPTANPQPLPMEVHHHPEVEKKTFKEYLLEGFMIFIAVMMGFFAENIRENITNNEHARQLTSQLVQDLKADTMRMDQIYRAQTEIVKANDSLFALLKPPLAKADLKKIQQYIIKSHNLWPFHATGGASTAIKNELHLKQFSDSRIISYIATYEATIELMHTVQDIYLQYQRTMLDPFLRQHFTPDNLYAAFNKKPLPDAQMRNLTQADLTQLRSDIVLISVVSSELVRDNRGLKDDATKLLNYIKKQYNLEDE